MRAGRDDLAVIDQQRLETLQLAGAIERVAVDVVEQQVGCQRRGGSEDSGQQDQQAAR
jgi:hypothetical protein